jgi:hypothetical protein
MANLDNPNGFTPIGCMSGADWHSKLRDVCFLASDSTATFIGDLVKLSGTGSTDGLYPAVAQCAAGDSAVGVLVSLTPDFESESTLSAANYRLASTLRYGKVAWGSDVLYSAQEDSVGGAMAVTAIGGNVDVVVGSGNTITGLSGMELDSSSVGTGNTLALRVHKVDNTIGNALGTNARWVVSINLDQDTSTTGV